MRENKYLNENERYVIEVELAAGTSKSEIARKLKRARCTIQREITRGLVEQMDGNTGKTYLVYKADWAQKAAKRRWQAKGTALKIGHDFDTAETLERLIRDNKWSPDAALGYAIKNKLISTIITTPTLYSYIKAGVLSITEKDLPRQGAQRKKNKEIYRHAHHNIRGKSIEARPKEASARNTFGHWEGDLIVGKKGTKTVCLTLVERMTRYVITRELPSKQAANVVNAFDYLEKCYGRRFMDIFKTVTFDNGTEFADFEGMEKSRYKSRRDEEGKGGRCLIYYAHPYCSRERGSNENCNGLLRRAGIKKSSNIALLGTEAVKQATAWVNNLPRRILGYQTAKEAFEKEVANLSVYPQFRTKTLF